MEDLNVTYAHLLTNGSMLPHAMAPVVRYIAGWAANAATRRTRSLPAGHSGTG
jgi:hypothetical protein